eukprot:Tbor_TRINITY_DN5710_c0_g2::TRINITY_DN5710_c0_g2_i1::g.20178::m.20178
MYKNGYIRMSEQSRLIVDKKPFGKRMSLLFVIILVKSLLMTFALGAKDTPPSTTGGTNSSDLAFRISTPDIYPVDKLEFIGEVEVKIVGNSPESDIYYTKDGSMPTNKSRLYLRPFTIFEPGKWKVQAIAIPSYYAANTLESTVGSRTYTVLPSEIWPPTVTPIRGTYRGSVDVKLVLPTPHVADLKAKIMYVIDVEDPGDTWMTFSQDRIITFYKPGDHLLKAYVIIGEGPKAKRSPIAQFRYRVTPPLLYDVHSDCIECNHLPTVGHIFSVFLQNALPKGTLFLTTSSKGCENVRHFLDDTVNQSTFLGKSSYQFVTYVEAEPKVFVCLKEPGSKVFVKVPRRIKSRETPIYDGSFSIEPPVGRVKKIIGFTPPPQQYSTYDNMHAPGANSGAFFSIMLLVILISSVGVGVFIIGKGLGRSSHHRAANRDETVLV